VADTIVNALFLATVFHCVKEPFSPQVKSELLLAVLAEGRGNWFQQRCFLLTVKVFERMFCINLLVPVYYS
jgi:hypothetical protein